MTAINTRRSSRMILETFSIVNYVVGLLNFWGGFPMRLGSFVNVFALATTSLLVASPSLARAQEQQTVPDQLSPELRFCERRAELAGVLADMRAKDSASAIDAFKAVESMESEHLDYLRGAVSEIWRLFPAQPYTGAIPTGFDQSYKDKVMIECMDQAFSKPDEKE